MYTIFTVDVEGHVGNDPVERLIYGRTKDGKICGIDMIMDMLDQYQIRGLFFVDIAEAWAYGDSKIAKVLRHIRERGHDVGVHIHPDHMADKKRMFLSEYSKDEQYRIIRDCTEFYVGVLGEKPIAFRAGKYGANRETLDVLAELGYRVDFSEFYGQKWCHIDPPVAKVNVQRLDNGLIEIPVTSFVSLDIGGYSRHDKMDCTQCFAEFKTLFNKLEKNNTDVAVLFAHSFSMIDWRKTPNSPTFNNGKKKRLEKQLEFLDKRSDCVQYINIKEAVDLFSSRPTKGNEDESFVRIRGLVSLYASAKRFAEIIKSRYDIRARRT